MRRHHYRRRVEVERKKRFRWFIDWETGLPNEKDLDWAARFHANTPQVCSCTSCGNPRYHFNAQTRQEVKAELDAKAQYEDIDLVFYSRFRSDW